MGLDTPAASSPAGRREALLSPPWLGALAALYLAFALERLTNHAADPDLWGYLAFARLFFETGKFPYQDVFAYLPTLEQWVYHEWLTGVLLLPLYSWGGAAGLQVLKYGFGLATVFLVYLTARLRHADPAAIILVLLLVQALLALGYSPVRAQVFTYFFFALTLYLLESARQTGGWRRLAWLIPIQMVWANLHGGFLAGLGLIVLYLLGALVARQRVRPYAAALLLAAPASLVNPYGLDYWRYLWQAVTMPRPEITEWVSLLGAYQRGKFGPEFFNFIAVGAFTCVFLYWRRLSDLTVWVVLGLLFLLGLKHLRHQVFFYLAAGAFLPAVLTPFLQDLAASRFQAWWQPGWARAALGLAVAGLITYQGYAIVRQDPLSLKFPPLPVANSKTEIYYPVQALALIKREGLSGPLLTEFNWGEYLIWELYPQCRVSLDGRFETVYPHDVCQAYFTFLDGKEGWREFLATYPPRLILIDSRSPLARLLKQEPTFREIFQDGGSILFLRRDENSSSAWSPSP